MLLGWEPEFVLSISILAFPGTVIDLDSPDWWISNTGCKVAYSINAPGILFLVAGFIFSTQWTYPVP